MRQLLLASLISAFFISSCTELLPLAADIIASQLPPKAESTSPEEAPSTTTPPSLEGSESSGEEVPTLESPEEETAPLSTPPAEGPKADVLEATNQERLKWGLIPLTHNAKLEQAAQSHAEKMAAVQMLEHDLNGSTMTSRIEATGYQYSRIAENISFGYDTGTEAVEGWMNSPGHRENILTPELLELGVGYATAADGTIYWVQNFGRPL